MKGKMNMCLFSFYSLLYVVLCTYVLGISENHYYNENISDEQLNERSRTLNDNNNDNNNRNDEISFANEIVRFIENNKDDKEDKNVKIISRPVQNTLNRITGSSFLNIKKYGRKAEYLNRSSFVQRSPVSGCQSKRMEPKWVCENKGNNNICIPDRRIQLCIKPLATIKNSRSEKADSDLLKDTLYASAMYETDLLWKKYGLRRFDNFCDDVKNSYVDYKNVIYGTDIDKNGISALVETALKRFFKEDSTVLNPDAWWAKHGKGLWKSMIRPYESFGCKKPDENEPQVNRWLKEWGKYNCKLMKEKEKFVINECSVNKKKTDCSNSCNNECFNYRNLISRQKYEFTRLANKYIQVIKYSIFKRKLAQPDNAIDFIKVNCSECKDIDFKTLFEFEYGKYEEKCVCQSYIDLRIQFKDQDICSFDPEIDSASNKKKFCLEKPEFKPWQCDKNAFEKFHNEGVCVSPRRQTFCLGNLKYISRDNIYNVHNTQLLMEIIMASKQEGKLLWKKHGLILDNDHACNYINDSYVDYKDVVIGNDLWNDRQSVKVQINLNKIFERNFSYKVGSNKLFKTIKELKTVWWILNRNKIWESLKCGIDEADPRGNSCERIDDLEYVPQFYRWFAQWAHYFCREKEDWEFKLGETCIDTTGKSLCNKETCKNVCTDMNYWIYSRKIAYNIQSSKYYKVRNSFSRAKDKDVSIFLKENTNSCSNIDFTKIFGELDRMFKEKCPCIDIKALEKKNAERLYLEANIGEGRYIDDDDEEDEEPQEYQNYVNVTSGNIDTKSNTKEMVKNKDQKQHQTKGATQSSESLALRDNKDSDSSQGKSIATDVEKMSEQLNEAPKDAPKRETKKEEKQKLPQIPEKSQEQAKAQGQSESEKTSIKPERSEIDQPKKEQEQKEPSSSTEERPSEITNEHSSSQGKEKSNTEKTVNTVVVDKDTSSKDSVHGTVDEEQMKDLKTSTGSNVSLKVDENEDKNTGKPLESTLATTESSEQNVQITQPAHTPDVEGEKAENIISPVNDNSGSESDLSSTNDNETTTDVVKEQEKLEEGKSVSETLENSLEKTKDVDPSRETSGSDLSGMTSEEEIENLPSKSMVTSSEINPGSNEEQDSTGHSVEVNSNGDNNSSDSVDNPNDVINREDTTAAETEDTSETVDLNEETSTEVLSTTVTTPDGKPSGEEEEKKAKEIEVEHVEPNDIQERMEDSVNIHSPADEEDVEHEKLESEDNELHDDTSRVDISEEDLKDIESITTEIDNKSLGDSSDHVERTEHQESGDRELRQHDFRGEQLHEKDFDSVESDLENEEIKKLLNMRQEEEDNVEKIHRTHYSMDDRDNSPFHNNNLSREEKMNQYKNRNVSEAKEEIMEMSKINKCSNDDSLKYCEYMERNKDLLETCSLENRLHLCCAISDYCLKFFNPNSLEYFNCTQTEFDDPSYNCFRKQRFTNMHYIAGGGIVALLLFILGSASYKKNLNDEEGFYDSNLNDSAFEYNNNNYNKLPYMFDQQINVANSDLYSEGVYDDTTTF